MLSYRILPPCPFLVRPSFNLHVPLSTFYSWAAFSFFLGSRYFTKPVAVRDVLSFSHRAFPRLNRFQCRVRRDALRRLRLEIHQLE